jgi:hypothetical protein
MLYSSYAVDPCYNASHYRAGVIMSPITGMLDKRHFHL